jgi:hypothetical protein
MEKTCNCMMLYDLGELYAALVEVIKPSNFEILTKIKEIQLLLTLSLSSLI